MEPNEHCPLYTLLREIGIAAADSTSAVRAYAQLLRCCFSRNVYDAVEVVARAICEQPLRLQISKGMAWLWTIEMRDGSRLRLGVTAPSHALQQSLLACRLVEQLHCPFANTAQLFLKGTRVFDWLGARAAEQWRPAALSSLALALKTASEARPLLAPVAHTCLTLAAAAPAVRAVRCSSWWRRLLVRVRPRRRSRRGRR
jgi:hypothetical protein